MKKTLGVDIGERALHAAVCHGEQLKRVLNVELPEGLVRGGQIVSWQAMGDYLRELRRSQRLGVRRVSLVLNGAACCCRRFTTAYMTHEQLRFNLPYEFRDFVTGDKDDYIYDYAVIAVKAGGDGAPRDLELMAAAVKRSLMAELERMFRRAGFRLTAAVPVETAYSGLLRAGGDRAAHSHCVLDLGHTGVRLYMYSGDAYETLYTLEPGCGALIEAVAEGAGVDVHLAASYLEAGYNGCARLPRCLDVCGAIAGEAARALNFYRFGSGGEPNHVHICGGGCRNEALVETLKSVLPLPVEDMSECMPAAGRVEPSEASAASAAVGAALLPGRAAPPDDPRGMKMPRRRTPPAKRAMNLMLREKKPFRPSRWIPGVLAVLLLAGLFGKYAVYDRFAALNRAEAELRENREALAAAWDACAGYGEVEDRYAHYSYAGFDRSIADRLDVMALLERRVFPVCPVTRLSVSGKTVSMTLTGLSLSRLSQLAAELEAEPLVASATVSTTGYNDRDAVPTADVTVLLADADKEE